MPTPSGRYQVQVGKGAKGSYKTKYDFMPLARTAAHKWYEGINIGNGYKKRLVAPNGRVVRRDFS